MIKLPYLSNKLTHSEKVTMGAVNLMLSIISSTAFLAVEARAPVRFPHLGIGVYIISE
jgi:hypothetical protein